MKTVGVAIVLGLAMLGCDDGPSDDECRAVGNQPPCCEFFGHRETAAGYCEEGSGFDPDAGP